MKQNKRKIDFIPNSLKDIEEIKEWYNEKTESLGYEFIYELEITIGKIIENPYAYAKKYKNMRQIKTNRFPYLVENKSIIILSILHGGRNPKIFKNRTKFIY